ncbi:putative mRNA cleavage factor complex component Pcf11 [Aspergillus homomorphus CBS 101889]|uniref:mRNA cleavage factor complex component Pcf11 n=1 Tax=Aspergillus homomorphus (strain CBS 101889) TaxID=1450537 RepID=A0A395HS29_ASPHC|nr:mRNA cleavage factor complex component Pcf11 [Aspergillus homomorphus CBS 101889]RAL10761.1 mRNA cleavage factor complex component Pcf11 [Aspergillus homomorphus CBS 101889]
MSSGLASDEVAEDYKNSLEDLTTNDRFQISNLTVIAKENTEHAMAISRVLENHIRTTPPAQKLPALYVVDSIVKNVGTPYTLFLGRNMYQTFMNAYTLVDSQTRRKLDEMLKTWKEPVPGSLDTRPVFPPEITRSIESALIKARTAALQQQQARSQHEILTRGRNGTPLGWSNTQPPAQTMARYPPASSQTVPVHSQRNGAGHAYPPSGDTHVARATPTIQVQQRLEIDLSALNRDIEALIATARVDFANNHLDPSVQQRLKALLDLQGILQRHELTQEQLKLVRDQVSALAPKPVIPVPPAQTVPAVSTPPVAATPPTHTHSQPLQQLLNPGMLAGLIKATAARQQPTPPPQLAGILPQIPVMSNTPHPAVPAAPENPLIAALRAQGLLPPASAPPTASTVPPSNIASAFPLIVPGQVRYTPPIPTPQAQGITEGQLNVQLNTASIKIPRHTLIATLYEMRSNRCGTCGRRFFATEEGKERKARHLDWHFRTNQRMCDAAKRAQNRSWYVDERDWIKSREAGDDQDLAETEASGDTAGGHDSNVAKKGPSKPWIRAPNDAALRNTPCPICQEKFESTWSEEVQDWIWQDATKVGSRVYHASCYAEVTKEGPNPANRGAPLARTGTPDSVLGKRKAEGTNSPGQNVRIKTEPV